MATSDGNYHLGHMLLEALSNNPEGICQIDAGTGRSETNASVLHRTITLARCFRALRLQPGDVLALGGRNHLDLHIPYYAALMTGLPVAGIDPLHKYDEINTMFKITKPKIIFCDSDIYEDVHRIVQERQLDTKIVTFDGHKGDCTLTELLETYRTTNVREEFKPTDFEGDKVFSWLVSTSGTTGLQKYAAFYHSPIIKMINFFKKIIEMKNGDTTGTCLLNLAPVQWISGYFNALISPIFGTTKVQTSISPTGDHVVDIINQFQPRSTMMGPALASQILKSSKPCDWTCFYQIVLSGSKVHDELLLELRKRVGPGREVVENYGQTETLGPVLKSDANGPVGSCGVEYPMFKLKLVDPETEEEITEPNKPGELWAKGPGFAGYYNMPEETAKAFSPDGYYKTGDILYKDENGCFFYVDRIKMLIKYKNYHVVPTELEAIIRNLEGVEEVAVTGVPDLECGELPAACVVLAPGGRQVTAEEIKQAVSDHLSDSKRLRGGVLFQQALPVTSTGKVARGKLRQLVETSHRE